MPNKTILSNLTLYGLSHALVDAACAAALFASFPVLGALNAGPGNAVALTVGPQFYRV